MIPVALLLSCADPAAPAVAVCQAVPGVAVDAEGLALLEPLLVEEELQILRKAVPTLGLIALGPEGTRQLRSQTVCTAGEPKEVGRGKWTVPMSRTQPLVNTDGTLGDPDSVEFETPYVVHQVGDEFRVETGLVAAADLRAQATTALNAGDVKEASAVIRRLSQSYPDPLLAYDVVDAAWAKKREEYLRFIPVKAVEIDEEEGVVVVRVKNSGVQAVSQANAVVVFNVEGKKKRHKIEAGPLKGREEKLFRVPIPEGADDKITMKAVSVEFPQE